MLALADDAALARLLIAAAVIDFSIEGGKAMGERDEEADPQTKIRLTYTHLGPPFGNCDRYRKAGAPYVRFAGVPDIDYFCDDCKAEMLSAEYEKP